ncbi:MAG: class I SAM-dependent methyltransferase [Promethearchaeota archaeon]
MSVADIFNDMANIYDEMQELLYAWLFSRLHFIITKEIIMNYNPKTVLDVGCGTGLQSFLHATVGASVIGVDIAEDLIAVAKKKTSVFKPGQEINLFPVYYEFVHRYNKLIASLLREKIRPGEYSPPNFLIADAKCLPFPNESFDHVNCCGSVVCFIENHPRALFEFSRVLKRGGTILLEVDSRWNMDRLWSVMDALLKGRWGYDISLTEALKAICTPPIKYIFNKWPLGQPEDQTCRLKAFTAKGLKRELSNFHLEVLKRWTIHSITNFIPSTFLDMVNPPKWLRKLFPFFANLEERIPFSLPGLSMVLLARKEETF